MELETKIYNELLNTPNLTVMQLESKLNINKLLLSKSISKLRRQEKVIIKKKIPLLPGGGLQNVYALKAIRSGARRSLDTETYEKVKSGDLNLNTKLNSHINDVYLNLYVYGPKSAHKLRNDLNTSTGIINRSLVTLMNKKYVRKVRLIQNRDNGVQGSYYLYDVTSRHVPKIEEPLKNQESILVIENKPIPQVIQKSDIEKRLEALEFSIKEKKTLLILSETEIQEYVSFKERIQALETENKLLRGLYEKPQE